MGLHFDKDADSRHLSVTLSCFILLLVLLLNEFAWNHLVFGTVQPNGKAPKAPTRPTGPPSRFLFGLTCSRPVSYCVILMVGQGLQVSSLQSHLNLFRFDTCSYCSSALL